MRWRLGAGRGPTSRLTLLRPARLGNRFGRLRSGHKIFIYHNDLRRSGSRLLCDRDVRARCLHARPFRSVSTTGIRAPLTTKSRYFSARISTSAPLPAARTDRIETVVAPAASSAARTDTARRPASTRSLLEARGSTTMRWLAWARAKSPMRRRPEAVRLSEPDWKDADDRCRRPPAWLLATEAPPLSPLPCNALVAASARRASLRASEAARACAAASFFACSASACA